MDLLERWASERQAWYDALGDESSHHSFIAFDKKGDSADLIVSKSAFGFADYHPRPIAWRWNEIKSFHQKKGNFVSAESVSGEKCRFRLVDKQNLLAFFSTVRDCGEEAGFAVVRDSEWLVTGLINLIIRPFADIVPDPQNPVDENMWPFEAGYLTPAIGGPRSGEWTRYRTAADTLAVARRLSFPTTRKTSK